jgi:hypothetical protein
VDETAERVARNDATFRDANEKIRAAAEGVEMERIPFLCECADERCHALVRLSLDEYERVRSESTLFVNATGHQRAAGPHADVVEDRGDYVIVRKVGRAGEIVEELDPRENSVE